MPKSKNEPDPESFLPLTPTVFDILLALVDGERHGYAIMQEVGGRLLPGTLYRALTRLLESGLVEASEQRPDPELDDERRRYYRLTDLGRRVIEAEAQRLAEQVRAARAKKLIQNLKRV
jgi:DNA-binding PadR family transcriptional regulator